MHEREQKAEQHLEGRTDNRQGPYGKRRKNATGLDAERRFTEGLSFAPIRISWRVVGASMTQQVGEWGWNPVESGVFGAGGVPAQG
jgi:hypothetical protein